ncbi:hypothetical protein EDB89DRAFT_1905918 [Lactarius sanguifluus]|nr:hypothetical protein EDB89DRAFT_1905918 [Lactarius sanguifluus]
MVAPTPGRAGAGSSPKVSVSVGLHSAGIAAPQARGEQSTLEAGFLAHGPVLQCYWQCYTSGKGEGEGRKDDRTNPESTCDCMRSNKHSNYCMAECPEAQKRMSTRTQAETPCNFVILRPPSSERGSDPAPAVPLVRFQGVHGHTTSVGVVRVIAQMLVATLPNLGLIDQTGKLIKG